MRIQTITSGLLTALLLATFPALAQPDAPAPAPPAPVAPKSEVPAATASAPATDERPHGFIPQLSLGGAVGLLHMSSAEIGPVGQLRLGLHGEFFTASNVLVERVSPPGGDHNTRVQAALSFGASPFHHFELFGAILGSANRNQRLCATDANGKEHCVSEPNRTDPELIKAYGDLILGGKLAYPVAPGFSVGGELGVRLLASTAGIYDFSPDSTSLWVSALATYDLKPVTDNIPVRFHLNLGYYVDNSSNLQDYDAAKTSAASRYVSKFAYGISENRFRLALGADAPFADVVAGLSLRPMLEYHFEYLTGSKDKVIYDHEHLTCGTKGAAACADNQDLHWLTLGVQAQVVHGLTFTVGLDVALRSPGYAYAPSLPPWNLLFGIGYPFDLVTRVATVQVPVGKVEPLREGLVAGRVSTPIGTPVEGAVVGVAGRLYSRVLTDADGSFQSVPLPAGLIELVIVANGFETLSARLDVVAGQIANVAFTLTPRAPPTRAVGRITEDSGKGVAAALKLAGPQIAEGKSDDLGNFAVPVPPGQYVLRVDADNYLSKVVSLPVAEGRESPVSIILRPRRAVAGVTFRDGKLKLRQAVTFKSVGGKPSHELTVDALHLLDEVVDVLVNHPEIRQLRVEAHWDRTLPPARAQELTDAQAKAVAQYLADQGVGQERVVAEGMGASKPLVPNLGKAAKPKNRRIEFAVVN